MRKTAFKMTIPLAVSVAVMAGGCIEAPQPALPTTDTAEVQIEAASPVQIEAPSIEETLPEPLSVSEQPAVPHLDLGPTVNLTADDVTVLTQLLTKYPDAFTLATPDSRTFADVVCRALERDVDPALVMETMLGEETLIQLIRGDLSGAYYENALASAAVLLGATNALCRDYLLEAFEIVQETELAKYENIAVERFEFELK